MDKQNKACPRGNRENARNYRIGTYARVSTLDVPAEKEFQHQRVYYEALCNTRRNSTN
jgi:hypothetical protein